MPDAQKLCLVDDALFIKGRGPCITTNRWEGGELKVGDWIELRSADGENTRAQLKSFEMTHWVSTPRTSVGGRYSLLLAHIDRSLIHPGVELWSVVDLPGEA